MTFMRMNRTSGWRPAIAAVALLALVSGSALSKEPSSALELARQLNQAFIEVADQVSPAVVVIRVAHKVSASESNLEEDNPFWDLVPRQFRKQLEEQQRENQRRGTRPRTLPQGPVFDG